MRLRFQEVGKRRKDQSEQEREEWGIVGEERQVYRILREERGLRF